MPDYMDQVRQVIKIERVKRGLSQADLAEMLGKGSKQYISRIEGKGPLSMEQANEILSIFGKKCSVLIEDDSEN